MQLKRILPENPFLGHYAKDKGNLVTTDGSKTWNYSMANTRQPEH